MTKEKSKLFIFYTITFILSCLIIELFSYILSIPRWDNGTTVTSARHIYSPYRGHELNPLFNHKESTLGIKIHSLQGFRRNSDVLNSEEPENVYRIIALGGSALYGIGGGSGYPNHRDLLNNETIDFNLEQILNSKFNELKKSKKKIEVINAAVTGYWTFQHVIYFIESLYQYEPDMLIFFDGHNDFYATEPYNHMKEYGYSSIMLSNSFNNRYFIFSIYTFSRYLAKYSYFFSFVERILESLWDKYNVNLNYTIRDMSLEKKCSMKDLKNRYKEVSKNSFIRSYYMLKSLSQYYHFDMVIFLQPEVTFEKDQNLSESDLNMKSITLKYYGCKNEIEKREMIKSILPEIFYEIGIPFYDLSIISSKEFINKNLYLDYCHLSPAGSKVVADKMSDILFPILKNKIK